MSLNFYELPRRVFRRDSSGFYVVLIVPIEPSCAIHDWKKKNLFAPVWDQDGVSCYQRCLFLLENKI